MGSTGLRDKISSGFSMDRYSIFGQSGALRAPKRLCGFSAEAGGKPAIAERDLEAALQLLAERARYLTGASGASIGLRSGATVICRANAGPSGLELGSRLPVDSGLMAESLRLRQILRCDDAENDSRVSGESWRELGIKSAMVGPLLREGEVFGVFELLAERAYAFEKRDVATLQRLSEMILTALEHFDAATQPLLEASSSKPEKATANTTESAVAVAAAALSMGSAIPASAAPAPSSLWRAQKCQTCGFPVSESRTLCLDCEEAESAESNPSPAFLGHLSAVGEPGWLQSHLYTMGTLFIAALTVALLVLKLK
jgi:hypothetical protein